MTESEAISLERLARQWQQSALDTENSDRERTLRACAAQLLHWIRTVEVE